MNTGRQVYKRTLCAMYQRGVCASGGECTFAHGNRELRSMENPFYKAQLCTAYEQGGVCQIGTDCLFAHGEFELRHDDVPAVGEVALAKHVEKEQRELKKGAYKVSD